MGTTKNILPCRRRSGFSVVEVMIVGGLMSLLVILISSAWTGPARSLRDAVLRCRFTQEANLAAEILARDFGGYLLDQTVFDPDYDYFVGSRVNVSGKLQICFDGDSDDLPDWALPDTVITYELRANGLQEGEVQTYDLVRLNEKMGTEFTVATNLLDMAPTDQGDGVNVILKFPYPDARDRAENNDYIQYTIRARDP